MISRSGAGILAELTALGKPAVFIPLATAAGNEQAHNAPHLKESGAAVALLGDVTGGHLREAAARNSAIRSAGKRWQRRPGHTAARMPPSGSLT